jgi:hypothetical protein
VAGQGRRGRSLESWNALTQGNRNRWIRAFGGNQDAALEAYRQGESLNAAQRGHATTPERPSQALTRPYLFPRYVANNTERLNELARQRGLAQHGQGPRGDTRETDDYDLVGPFTWVEPQGTLDNLPGWRRNVTVYDRDYRQYAQREGITPHEGSLRAAQLWARKSGAPAGVVVIQEEEEGWGVWFVKDSGDPRKSNKKGTKSRRRP